MLRKNFPTKKFLRRNVPEARFPRNVVNARFFALFLAPRVVLANAAWRLCFAKISVRKNFFDGTFRKQGSQERPWTQETFYDFCPPAWYCKRCVAPVPGKNFPAQKFQQRKVPEARFPRKAVNATYFAWFFAPPAWSYRRCVAPMLRKNFVLKNFFDETFRKQGSQKRPWKNAGTCHKFWSPVNETSNPGLPGLCACATPKLPILARATCWRFETDDQASCKLNLAHTPIV